MNTIKTLKNDSIILTSEFARTSNKGNEVFNLFVEYNGEKYHIDESVGEYSDEFMNIVFNQITDYIENNTHVKDHKNTITFTVPTEEAVVKNTMKIIMLKRIFNIMDLRYRNSASLIKSIKFSIVKDLKNNPK